MNTSPDVAQSTPLDLNNLDTKLFIDGQFVPSDSKQLFDVENPADGTVLATVSSASESDARRALDSACAVQASWAETPAQERSDILYRAYEILKENRQELATLMSRELGRALPDSLAEVDYGAGFFRWFAQEAERIHGDYKKSPTSGARLLVHKQPVGPTLAITPWNFPLAMGTRKIGPALAAGCTIIVKPAKKTPLTMLYLARVLSDAGLPDGVLAVLPTAHASQVSNILDDPRLRKFTFTGSTEVGLALSATAAQHNLRVSLELGGNAPYIVLDTADIALAARSIAVAKMRSTGQVCIAANRFLVQESVHDEFVAKVIEVLDEFKVGRPLEEGVSVGAMSGADALESVQEIVRAAEEAGANKVYEAKLPADLPADGYYFPPTVLDGVAPDSPIAHTEIFGPVIAIETFKTTEEAIELANNTPFGLAAYVFGTGVEQTLDVAEKIQAGMVAINRGGISDVAAPFGGIKESGLGREGGSVGIDEYLDTKLITLP